MTRYGRTIPVLNPPLEEWELRYFYQELPARRRETESPRGFTTGGTVSAGRNSYKGGGKRYWTDP